MSTIESPIATALTASASPLRRLGAMIYDSFLVAAVLFVAALFFAPFNDADHQLHGMALYLQRVWLLFVFTTFFVYFWTRKGKTLGMQAWKLSIQNLDGNKPSVRDALLRLLSACLPWMPSYIMFAISSEVHSDALRTVGFVLLLLVPVNYLVGYFDPQRRALHDRLLKTKIVM